MVDIFDVLQDFPMDSGGANQLENKPINFSQPEQFSTGKPTIEIV